MRSQLILDLHDELIVDNFAGGGGFSTGIEMGLGRYVDHAINHDRFALGMHRINHPQTVHHCEDVFDVDPATICQGRPVGYAHFSPDCKHFSKAKGGKPLDKKIRGLILVMLRWAKYGARVMSMENVEEITTYGPLKLLCKKGVWGWYPDPEHKGRTWRALLDILGTGIDPDHPDLPEILDVLAGSVTKAECVRGFGYRHEAKEIRAYTLGSPTIRKRLFMLARRDGRPIVWPEATHAGPNTTTRRTKPWRTIAECIDWTRPCPSIFLTRAEAKVARCKRPLAKATLRRVAMGVDRHVLKSKKPFLVSLTHQGGERVEPIDQPARTLTAAHRGEKALVAPALSRFNGSHRGCDDGSTRNYSLEQPLSVQETSNRFALTAAQLAPFITEHANATHQRNFSADEPARTTCAEVKGGHFAVVSGTLIGAGGPAYGGEPRPLDEPVGTLVVKNSKALVTANLMVNTSGHAGGAADAPAPTIPTGGHHAVVVGTLVQTGYGEREGQEPRALDVEKPLGTIVAGGGKHAVVAGTLLGVGGRAAQSRPRGADEPLHTCTAKADTGLAVASLVTMEGAPETHPPGQPVDAPLRTIMAEGNHHYLSAAYLAQHNAGYNATVGHEAAEPLSTISTTGSQQAVVAASLTAYYGSDRDGQAVTEPSRTLLTKPRLGLVESIAFAPPMTEAQIFGARRVAAFLRAHGVRFEGEFATVEGFVIVDLGMRMLTPRELFRAQGFGNGYIIDRAWVADSETGALREVLLTKEQQIRMCGNSVCPQVAAALVRANVPEMIVWGRGESIGIAA